MVDCAYAEFAECDLTQTALKLPNAIVFRTVSKALGLAGLQDWVCPWASLLDRRTSASWYALPCLRSIHRRGHKRSSSERETPILHRPSKN